MDPIGLAGGLNLYGFAAGDPVNYSDPFGLCQEKNGTKRPCKVEWSSEASNTNVTDETRKVAQAIADAADVDLVLSSGRRAEGSNCAESRHDCGKAFDIKTINGVDIGQGQDFNPEALDLVVRVQATAFGMSQVRENFGPAGILKSPAAGQPQAAVTWDARAPNNIWLQHRNHVHISIH